MREGRRWRGRRKRHGRLIGDLWRRCLGTPRNEEDYGDGQENGPHSTDDPRFGDNRTTQRISR